MNPQVAPFYDICRLNGRLLLNALDNVDDGTARQRPAATSNNMTFIALHVLDARCYLARMLGAEANHPFESQLESVRNIDEMKSFPALDEVRRAWREASTALEGSFRELTAERLTEKAPADFPVEDPTVLGGIAFLMQHESFHIGQLALLRRQAGLESMSY